jgi:hypothetical protein
MECRVITRPAQIGDEIFCDYLAPLRREALALIARADLSEQVSEVREHFDNLWTRNVLIHSEVLLLKTLNAGVAISQTKLEQVQFIKTQYLCGEGRTRW